MIDIKQNNNGFTLIEIVVVVGVLGVLMASITGVLMDTFKANNRMRLTDKLLRNGNNALAEIRKNLLNSKGSNVECNSGYNNSFSFLNIYDGQTITILCNDIDNKIASISGIGTTYDLISSEEVKVSNCSKFIYCDTLPSLDVVSDVHFNFTLDSGNAESGSINFVSKSFDSNITIRN